jgi:hypothetical protein
VEERDGVENSGRVAGRDVDTPSELGTDGKEDGVEAPLVPFASDVIDGVVEDDVDPQGDDPCDLGIEDGPGESVGGDAVPHHAPELRGRVDEGDGVAEALQMVGGTEPGGPGSDDEDALAAVGSRRRQGPAALDGVVTEEPLDGVDAHRLVELDAVARRLAGVVADATHHRRERIVLDEQTPRRFVVTGLGLVEPALDVLACRAGVVARRQPVDVDGSLDAPRTGPVGMARTDVESDRERAFHYTSTPLGSMSAGSSASRP